MNLDQHDPCLWMNIVAIERYPQQDDVPFPVHPLGSEVGTSG